MPPPFESATEDEVTCHVDASMVWLFGPRVGYHLSLPLCLSTAFNLPPKSPQAMLLLVQGKSKPVLLSEAAGSALGRCCSWSG